MVVNCFKFDLARSKFSHLDLVQAALVRRVNTLAAAASVVSRDRALVRALAAFSFITAASVRDPRTRLQLYLEAGQVAMMNHCLGQAEACFRAIATNIQQGDTTRAVNGSLRSFTDAHLD